MAVSERLQKKFFADKFPASCQTSNSYLIWFQDEDKYAIVDKKQIVEKEPKMQETVTVKDGTSRWPARIVFIGTNDQCKARRAKYEVMLNDSIPADEGACYLGDGQKGNEKERGSTKRKRKQLPLRSDSESDSGEDPNKRAMTQDVEKERIRVRNLLNKNPKVTPNRNVTFPDPDMKNFFETLFEKLDGIQNTLNMTLEKSSLESPSPQSFCTPQRKPKLSQEEVTTVQSGESPTSSHSPAQGLRAGSPMPADLPSFAENDEFIINGINFLTDVPAKAKKPSLYATQLLSHLFMDEEMRDGCVEPKDPKSNKPALCQEKINLLKKCIKIKYGEKTLKGWADIRLSLNQKCLDKRKQHKKKTLRNVSDTGVVGQAEKTTEDLKSSGITEMEMH